MTVKKFFWTATNLSHQGASYGTNQMYRNPPGQFRIPTIHDTDRLVTNCRPANVDIIAAMGPKQQFRRSHGGVAHMVPAERRPAPSIPHRREIMYVEVFR